MAFLEVFRGFNNRFLRPTRKFLVLGFPSSTCIVVKFACDKHTLVRRVALDKITDPASRVTPHPWYLVYNVSCTNIQKIGILFINVSTSLEVWILLVVNFSSVTHRYHRCTLSKHGKTWEEKVFPFTRTSFLRKGKNRRYGFITGSHRHFSVRNKDCKWKPSAPLIGFIANKYFFKHMKLNVSIHTHFLHHSLIRKKASYKLPHFYTNM